MEKAKMPFTTTEAVRRILKQSPKTKDNNELLYEKVKKLCSAKGIICGNRDSVVNAKRKVLTRG